MRKPHRCFLFMLMFFAFGIQKASAQVGKILIEGGKFILDYAAGKVVDKAFGLDYETELQEIEASLVAHLRRGAANTQDLRVQLEATRSQLTVLQTLLNSKPTSDELAQFRRQLSKDLEKLSKIQVQHDQRITIVEKMNQDHETRIKRLEERDNAGEAPHVAEPRNEILPRSQPEVSPLSPRDDFSYTPQTPPSTPQAPLSRPRTPSSTRLHARNSGVTLMVWVTGQSNQIRVSESEISDGADLGSFEVTSRGDRHMFWLLAGTGGVITIQGDGNIIHLPRHLCGRVRVVRKGSNNRIEGCK